MHTATRLKAHLFRASRRIATFDFLRHTNTLTHSLTHSRRSDGNTPQTTAVTPSTNVTTYLLTYLLLRATYTRRRQGRWCRCCRSRWSLDTWRCRCRPAARPARSASSRRPARGTGPSRDGSYLRPCTTWPAPADSLWPDTTVAGGRPAARGVGARSVTSPGEAALSRTGNSALKMRMLNTEVDGRRALGERRPPSLLYCGKIPYDDALGTYLLWYWLSSKSYGITDTAQTRRIKMWPFAVVSNKQCGGAIAMLVFVTFTIFVIEMWVISKI